MEPLLGKVSVASSYALSRATCISVSPPGAGLPLRDVSKVRRYY